MKKSIARSIVGLAAAGLAAAVFVAAVSVWGQTRSRGATEAALQAKDLTADVLPPPLYLVELRLLLSQVMAGEMTLDRATAELARLRKDYDERMAWWQGHPVGGVEQQLQAQAQGAAKDLLAAADALMSALKGGDQDSAQAALARAQKAYAAHRSGVEAIVKAADAYAGQAQAELADTEREVRWANGGALLLGSVALLMAGLRVHRRVSRPLERAVGVAHRVAEGDLDTPVIEPGSQGVDDETARLFEALQRMNQSLQHMVGEVRQASEAIGVASREIASGSTDLSGRTEAQASQLQQTAASMDQLAATVQQNTRTVEAAHGLTHEVQDAASQGGAVMDQVVATMAEIDASSRRIGDILGVIDGIAFQTNILALNAAVEAARAGEQGRGFAVVAGEVRNLAQRSASAAREIKALIGESAQRVEAGSRQVGEAGRSMQEIVRQVQRMTGLMAEITQATQAQQQDLQQVSAAVGQIDQMTQQNAALVEQSSAASMSLADQAERLRQMVAVFKLQQGAVPA